jgi:hypothetical protein
MKSIKTSLQLLGLGLLAFGVFNGCQSTDGGGSVGVSAYYGAGWYDPWYYGDYHGGDIIVVPPPDGAKPPPGGVAPPRPTHPIAKPPPVAPRPMPSIPSAPRGSFRR